jgi:hypothetical protein
MSKPREQGKSDAARTLDAWERPGRYSSMRDMMKDIADDILQELAQAQGELLGDLSEQSRNIWEEQVEYFKGWLSRLD